MQGEAVLKLNICLGFGSEFWDSAMHLPKRKAKLILQLNICIGFGSEFSDSATEVQGKAHSETKHLPRIRIGILRLGHK